MRPLSDSVATLQVAVKSSSGHRLFQIQDFYFENRFSFSENLYLWNFRR